MGPIFRIVVTLAFLLAPVFARAQGVVVVASDASAPYEQARDAIVREWVRAGGSSADIKQVVVTDSGAMEKAMQSNPRLIVTLGVEALRDAMSADSRALILASLIPRLAVDRLQKRAPRRLSSPLSVVYLDQPPGRQLDLLQLALPTLRQVGVLWGPESTAQRTAMASAAAVRHLEIAESTISTEAEIYGGLKDSLDGVDALVAIADPVVFNSTTISNILLTSYRAKVPMLAFSPAYVKAGALMAIYSTPAQIGAQTGLLARTIAVSGSSGLSQFPTDFTVTVNSHVARSLGLTLDAESLAQRLRLLERRP